MDYTNKNKQGQIHDEFGPAVSKEDGSYLEWHKDDGIKMAR